MSSGLSPVLVVITLDATLLLTLTLPLPLVPMLPVLSKVLAGGPGGWIEFISPGGTEPKGPWHAKYIQFVRFCRGLAQALELSLSAKLPTTSCLMS
jgi:hypothetical protein